MSHRGDRRDRGVVPYLTMHYAVGCLGILLPFVLAAGNRLIFSGGLQQSVSDYFYTGMRDVLVGGLCVIAAFLIAFRAQDRWEGLFVNAAGIGAAGVALFPTPPSHPSLWAVVVGYLHVASGSVLFIALAVIALWLFRRTSPDLRASQLKRLWRQIYLACGIVMVVSLAMAGIAALPVGTRLTRLDPIFWAESAAIGAFGVAWLVKGRAILRQRSPAGS